ncbi:MAG TPA: hypothetical protein VG406_28850 [Isosphaeraceae bacterium]|nr:hypothetical protein [Isosphaeraceae bacterium]
MGDPSRWFAEVYFLFDDAPHELLRPGNEFELYEGKTCVARGVIRDGRLPVDSAAEVIE